MGIEAKSEREGIEPGGGGRGMMFMSNFRSVALNSVAVISGSEPNIERTSQKREWCKFCPSLEHYLGGRLPCHTQLVLLDRCNICRAQAFRSSRD